MALIETIRCWPPMIRGSLTSSTRRISTRCSPSSQSYIVCVPITKVATALPRCVLLQAPVATPASIRRITPSPISSLWMPRSVCPISASQTASGTLPIPNCRVAPSPIRSATDAAIVRSSAVGSGTRTSISGRSTRYHPATSSRRIVWPPAVHGICSLISRKNGAWPISEAMYSALVPSVTTPPASGGLAAASTSEQRVRSRSKPGTPAKSVGTRSRHALRNDSRVAPARK